jgi:hypothetical protein
MSLHAYPSYRALKKKHILSPMGLGMLIRLFGHGYNLLKHLDGQL